MSVNPSAMTLDELRALPIPNFAVRDPLEIKKGLVAEFEKITGRALYPAQVEMFMIDLMSYALANVGSAQQNGLIQNRAIWAEGRHLDDLGANVGTFRLSAQYARCTVAFTLSESRNTSVIVPVGTRVAAGSTLIFRTVQELVIPAGNLSGSVAVIATQAGGAFNGLQIGQIQDILDPIAYVSAVSNTQISAGGSDEEDDDRFRERIADASDSAGGGGSRRDYIRKVKSAHPDIVDVEVIRPEPGHVHIYPLMKTGIAADAIDDAIIAYLDPETMIPMGDYVTIQKADAHTFDVAITLKVTPGMGASAVAAVEAAIRARFAVWGKQLGSQIAPSALIEDARSAAGVVGVIGPDFGFTDLNSFSFAVLGALTLNVEEAPNV